MDEVTNALADIACKQESICAIVIIYTTHTGEVASMAHGQDTLKLLGLTDIARQHILERVNPNNDGSSGE